MYLCIGDKKISDIILYGAGERCTKICRILKEVEFENVIIIDSDNKKWGKAVKGYSIYSPEKLYVMPLTNLCITVADLNTKKQIRDLLQKNFQYNLSNEIGYEDFILNLYKENKKIKNLILQEVIKNNKDYIFFDCYHNGLGLGGVEEWTKDICKSFIEVEKDNFYIISKKGSYTVPLIIKNNTIFLDIENNLYEERIFELVSIMIKKLPCKVVTSSVDEVLIAAAIIKQYYPEMIKIISVIHGDYEILYDLHVRYRNIIDIYIGVSKDIYGNMLKRGIESERIFSMTCPFPCEKKIYHSYTCDLDKPIRIGYAGRMDGFEGSQKRMDLLLKLIKLLDERNVNFQMELAGDGPVREQMEEYVHNNGLVEKVHFLGKLDRSQISAFWKQEDICVNISDYEGRSISIIEAMGNGAVPVVTKVSGTQEDITDGVNGYLIPLQDYHTMAERIQYLAENRERLPEMGQLAHDEVYPKSLMSEHLKFWEKILFNNN